MTVVEVSRSPVGSIHEMLKKGKIFPTGSNNTWKIEYKNPKPISTESESWYETLRLNVKKFLTTSLIGWIYDWTLLVISVLSTLQFIYQTYLDPNIPVDVAQIALFSILEECFAIVFMFDWTLSFYIADHKLVHITSFFSMVDLLTVVPIWVSRATHCFSYDSIQNFRDFVVYIVCGMGTTRILRALRIRKKLVAIEDEVQRTLGEMALAISVMLLFNAAVIQYLELQEQQLPFHTWVYFMWVTMATVGYGDVAARTILGRFAIMGMICFSIVTIPKMTNELIEKMNLQSIYARAYYYPLSLRSSHVVICGSLTSVQLEEFFGELFHPDHDNDNLHAVVLLPDSPSFEMLMLLRNPAYTLCVTYLEGSALCERDLRRAQADKATAIFIMTNKFTKVPDEEDSKTILQQFSICRFLANYPLSKPLFSLQLIRPENQRHFASKFDGTNERNIILCVNELKLGIVAKTVMFPGINTLIVNLLYSFSQNEDEMVDDELEEIENLDDASMENWLGEYQEGCEWEIYTSELSDSFVGLKFSELSETLYQRLGIVLFALEIEDLRKEKCCSRILLNPADFTIPPKDIFRVDAFVIAQNKSDADLSKREEEMEEGENSEAAQPPLNVITNGIMSRFSLSSESDETKKNAKTKKKYMWQELIKKYESNSQKSSNYQEELFEQEDEYLRNNFFIRSSLCEINDAIIKTSVSSEIPMIDGHLIVVTKSVFGLYDLIRPLRARYMESLRYIVILCPNDIPMSVWRRIGIFEGILIVRGSGLEEIDLRRAGVYRCSQVVVLADASMSSNSTSKKSNSGSDSTSSDALVDADTIFTYQCVKRMNESAHVVVEIISHSNVGYLSDSSNVTDYRTSPQFAAGLLFSPSLLDGLVCQAFYNPKIIRLLNEMIAGVDQKPMLTKKKGLDALVGSSIYLINIPDKLESRTYGSLFKYLATQGMIPLGLLRGIFPNMKLGPKANIMPYVFTNPGKDTELFSCDKVYVLSQTPRSSSKISGSEVSKEILLYESIRNKKNLAEDTAATVFAMRDELKVLDKRGADFETEFADFKDEILFKLESLMSSIRDLKTSHSVDSLLSNGALSALNNNNNNNNNNSNNNNNNNNASSSTISALSCYGNSGNSLKTRVLTPVSSNSPGRSPQRLTFANDAMPSYRSLQQEFQSGPQDSQDGRSGGGGYRASPEKNRNPSKSFG